MVKTVVPSDQAAHAGKDLAPSRLLANITPASVMVIRISGAIEKTV